jgi:hypothetical protein
VLSVPYTREHRTKEHFPDLYEFEFIDEDGVKTLHNITRDGRLQTFRNLVFHGGTGLALEMRVFAERHLRELLHQAGFDRIVFHGDPELEHGIYWHNDWSLPVTARAR